MQAISLQRILFGSLTLAGFAALCVAATSPWFSVPIAPPGGADSWHEIFDATPNSTKLFQGSLIIGLVLLLGSWLWKFQWSALSTAIASLMLMIPLAYPYAVIIHSPQVSADATWLQMQHDNLTWLGGDIYLNAEHGSKGWRSKAYIVDTPRQLSAVKLPSWSPWELGLHRAEDLVLWLGYSQSFCQFAKRGWTLAVLGALMLMLATLKRHDSIELSRLTAAAAIFTCVALVATIAGWSRPFLASQLIRTAAESSSQRDYESAHAQLERAIALMPVLSQDTHYISQRGRLDQKLDLDSEYAQLSKALDLERAGRHEQAFDQLQRLADSRDAAISRETTRAILRHAIQDYNSARFERAQTRFAMVLRRTPCDVKLLYLLQLHAIHESNSQRAVELDEWMYAATHHFNFGTRKVIRAASRQHVATAIGLSEDANAIWNAQRKAKRP